MRILHTMLRVGDLERAGVAADNLDRFEHISARIEDTAGVPFTKLPQQGVQHLARLDEGDDDLAVGRGVLPAHDDPVAAALEAAFPGGEPSVSTSNARANEMSFTGELVACRSNAFASPSTL